MSACAHTHARTHAHTHIHTHTHTHTHTSLQNSHTLLTTDLIIPVLVVARVSPVQEHLIVLSPLTGHITSGTNNHTLIILVQTQLLHSSSPLSHQHTSSASLIHQHPPSSSSPFHSARWVSPDPLLLVWSSRRTAPLEGGRQETPPLVLHCTSFHLDGEERSLTPWEVEFILSGGRRGIAIHWQ